MKLFFDKQGNEIDILTFSKLHNDYNYLVVKKTAISDKVEVSTVCLGLDHNYGTGKPIIFETMIFGGKLDQLQYRYRTEKAAKQGHDFFVSAVHLAESQNVSEPWHPIIESIEDSLLNDLLKRLEE